MTKLEYAKKYKRILFLDNDSKICKLAYCIKNSKIDCSGDICSACEFFDFDKCVDYLLAEHKEKIKLKQWEYDLIRNCEEVHDYDELDELCEYWAIEAMMKKGYFKGIKNLGATFKDILDNYIIVSDDYGGFEECK